MNEHLSLWSLIADAAFIVQIVMLLLFLASVVSWAMIVERILYFRRAHQQMEVFEDEFWSGVDLSQLYKRQADPALMSGGEAIFRAGFKEYSRLKQQSGADADAVMEGC